MCQENDSATSKRLLEARCPWCGFGILTVHDVSSDGEFPAVAGSAISQINCSNCSAQVQVRVGAQRAMLPFISLIEILNSLPNLFQLGSEIQSIIADLEKGRQAEHGKA